MDPSGASGAAAAGGGSNAAASSSQTNALNALPTPPRPPGLEAWMATHFPITFKQHLAAVDSQWHTRDTRWTAADSKSSKRRPALSAHVLLSVGYLVALLCCLRSATLCVCRCVALCVLQCTILLLRSINFPWRASKRL
jgi:hypothetical protein